ncbi:MAG: HAMP domain-containing histidine kinase [Planctomycetes bacterium]|nr:HAMP domain-containing histidine kinase [Planctomycetota bacterium]
MPHRIQRRRNLLALSTFLVPLAVLALLGWNELQRSGQLTEASLEREARQFLTTARAAVEQQLELQLQPAFLASQRLLVDKGPVRTVMAMRGTEGFPAVQHIVLVDKQTGIAWPNPAPSVIALPGVSDRQNEPDTALSAAELLITSGDWQAAQSRLTRQVETLEAANPASESGRGRRYDLEEKEVLARFRLAAVLRATGETDGAREQFERVRELANRSRGRGMGGNSEMPTFAIVADASLAELGTPEQCISVLTDIADNRYDAVADGLSTALANRLAATFASESPHRPTVERLLRENRQRAATREFAERSELVVRFVLNRPRQRRDDAADADGFDNLAALRGIEHTVTTFDDRTSLLAMRPATDAEQRRWYCSHVGIDFDLETLLSAALAAYVDGTGNYVLSVSDPDDVALVPPPEVVPEGFTPPEVNSSADLTLRAYPANAARLMAERAAATRTRTLLLIALFVTALGGAIWSWRSAQREAQLAALKIDLVSRVSHELKTPLALIRMYGETLGMGRARDSDQAAEFGTIIARESERLTTLIQRILDYSRQQNDTLDYEAQPHDLGERLREIAYAYAPHLESKGVILIDELPLGITATCDKNGLESAILNLLENAAKYGPDAEEHEVDLQLLRRAGEAVIEVRDRGRGIPDGEHQRVFEGFYRASNAGEVRGAGLGLGLVQHFARAHGGDIVALPRDGGGTIMRLTLPLGSKPPTPHSPARDAARKDPT